VLDKASLDYFGGNGREDVFRKVEPTDQNTDDDDTSESDSPAVGVAKGGNKKWFGGTGRANVFRRRDVVETDVPTEDGVAGFSFGGSRSNPF
jgi:hypothetical protein